MQPFGPQLVAGDSWEWSIAPFGDYNSSAWTLKYFFRGTDKQLSITGTADGSGWTVSATAADTADLSAGTYAWQMRMVSVADPTVKFEIARGSVEILPDIESSEAPYDGRSFAKRTLDSIRAVIENRASQSDMEHAIGGRSIKKFSHDELIRAEAYWNTQYQKELRDSDQSRRSNQVLVRFS